MLYLQKSSDEAISWCRCDPKDALVSVPGHAQADCPWCGCGWLYSCIVCRKAFTYARAVEIDATPKALVAADLKSFGEVLPSASMLAEGISTIERLDLIEGVEYAILDTQPVAVEPGPVSIRGAYGDHDLTELPQRAWRPTMADNHILGMPSYWHHARAAKRARVQ